ncbi:MAG: 4Fe-4S ferredoxin [Bacteroidetes bacterium HGW-Bacteroidetes-4]|jgi:D-lactate dehydrogenase|nr:MAG: 4Fe-4S ferredoxin [Bacteroidetes bacterium HGW-Bacteroidetes-4]
MITTIAKDTIKTLLKKLDKKQFLSSELMRIAYAADAGCYQKIPQLVIKSKNDEEVRFILAHLNSKGIPVTFRAAGTSLSGQAISDSVLLEARGDNWSKVSVLDDGKRVKTQIGITGNRLNQLLKPYKRKFGPDPASINSALIGGIIANNASGMSCGTHANSYATIESARIIFSDGTLLDTADPESCASFLKNKAEMVETLQNLKKEIESHPDLKAKITEKYQIKNTTGYGLNALVDFDDPMDIILHLMVGSEGTLGFVSEAVFKTVPVLPHRASAMIYFHSLKDACDAVPELKKARVSAIELLDREALRSVENQSGIPEYLKSFEKGVTALLIDLEAATESELELLMHNTHQALSNYNLVRNFELSQNIKQINDYWKIRKGVFPSVGGTRKNGTTVIIEDVAVKMEHLTQAVLDLRQMLDDNGYADAVIYGHALEGNLHFIFAPDFTDAHELDNYENLITKLVHLIIDKYKGSLKAEHGTGINMAPFVRYEWGEELYRMMQTIKKVFDPNHILNPGVIINDDPKAHLKHFKPLPLVDETVDKCIECGFCEINCLSTGYTLSARQRIVVLREVNRLKATQDNPKMLAAIEKQFQFLGNETCAADGLCATSCPLSIDTGILIKKLRDQHNSKNKSAQKWALRIAGNFDTTQSVLRKGLGFVAFSQSLLGNQVMQGLASTVRAASFNTIPAWNPYLPQAAKIKNIKPRQAHNNKLKVVYFPSCINQTMGPAKYDSDQKPLIQVTIEVLERAGYQVLFPEAMNQLCCGTPWESKGFIQVANQKSEELEKALLKTSNNGEYPVLCDTSPCIYRMKKVMDSRLKLYEPVEFAHDFLLDKLTFEISNQKLAFHITCSSTKMELTDKFVKVAQSCTSKAIFPEEVGCCGFAGDKGFSHPKLNDWALRKLKPAINGCQTGYSNSRTCEIGLSKNSGINYKSIMYLIDAVTKQKVNKA